MADTPEEVAALRAELRALWAAVLRVVCPVCGASAGITGPDDDLCLWSHERADGSDCPAGEARASIRKLLVPAMASATLPAPKAPPEVAAAEPKP
jgi:hypothetical protein